MTVALEDLSRAPQEHQSWQIYIDVQASSPENGMPEMDGFLLRPTLKTLAAVIDDFSRLRTH